MSDNKPNNKSEYGELIEFLIGHFTKIDERFTKIDEVLKTKSDKSDVDRLMNRMGQILDQIGDDRAQQIKTQRQVDRHEKWFYRIAEKIGLKLEN